MRARRVIQTLLFVGLLLAAVAGWTWGWRERAAAVRDADFLRRQLELVTAGRERLAKALAENQRAQNEAADQAKRPETERTVARLRDLPFVRPVTYRQIPRPELPAILRQKLAQQVPDREFGDTAISLAALGLLPENLDLKKTYLNLLGEQVGAFYDQHSAELFTFSGQPLGNGQNRVVLAHELTRALEDQHFQLARLPLEAKGNDDRALAASALVEGDATLVMSQYMLGDLSAATVRDSLAGALTTDMQQIVAAPRYLRESLLFPYLKGQEFCVTLFGRGGWAALDAAFQHPPGSSAEILHPERYAQPHPGWPVEVRFGDPVVLGQSPVGNNVLGEFGTRQWLTRWLKEDGESNQIASGWCGDRYLVFGDARHNSYVWKSVWSSPEAAARFGAAAHRCWQARYQTDFAKVSTLIFPEDPPARTDGTFAVAATSAGRRLALASKGAEVILIEAQDERWEKALEELPGVDVSANFPHDGQHP